MKSHRAAFVYVLRLAGRNRAQPILQKIARRRQFAVYKRSVGRPNINDRARTFWSVVWSRDRLGAPHVNVTSHPTAEWVALQIAEAVPSDGWVPRFLQLDRDGASVFAFRRQLKAMGIEGLVSTPWSPWRNAYVEHLVGSIGRERTHQITPMGEKDLLRTVGSTSSTTTATETTSHPMGMRRPHARRGQTGTWSARSSLAGFITAIRAPRSLESLRFCGEGEFSWQRRASLCILNRGPAAASARVRRFRWDSGPMLLRSPWVQL